MYLTVKELPESERPYEKCERFGAGALSDAELLAVILRTGSKKERVTELAIRVLHHSKQQKGLLGLYDMTLQELQQISGIGKVKAIQLLCVAELAKRMAVQTKEERISFQNPESIAQVYIPKMRHLKKEEVMLLLLDSRMRKIIDKITATGTVNAAMLDIREILVEAVRYEAVYMIVLHNHPSGNPEPSKEDISVTKRLQRAGELLGIPLRDHIIIGDNTYFSMQEHGFL